jgi:UDP-glucose 4-epimerase
MKCVLVTGGSGFIGSHVCELLLEKGYTVSILDIVPSAEPFFAEIERFHQLDMTQDTPQFKKAFHGIDAVIHCAGNPSLWSSLVDFKGNARANLVGTINVLSAAQSAGVQQFIFASSYTVYGETGTTPATEVTHTRPQAPYSVSKLASEQYIALICAANNIKHANLRLGSVYGARQKENPLYGVVGVFLSHLVSGKNITIFGDGSQSRDYTRVQDVARAFVLVLERELSGTFNVGTGKQTTVKDLLDVLARLTNTTPHITHAPARSGETKHTAINPEKIRSEGLEFGSLEAGVHEMIRQVEILRKNAHSK